MFIFVFFWYFYSFTSCIDPLRVDFCIGLKVYMQGVVCVKCQLSKHHLLKRHSFFVVSDAFDKRSFGCRWLRSVISSIHLCLPSPGPTPTPCYFGNYSSVVCLECDSDFSTFFFLFKTALVIWLHLCFCVSFSGGLFYVEELGLH